MRSFLFFTFLIKSSKSNVCFTLIAHLNRCSMATCGYCVTQHRCRPHSGSRTLEFPTNRIPRPLPAPVGASPEPVPRSETHKEQLFDGHVGGTLTNRLDPKNAMPGASQ